MGKMIQIRVSLSGVWHTVEVYDAASAAAVVSLARTAGASVLVYDEDGVRLSPNALLRGQVCPWNELPTGVQRLSEFYD